MGVFLGLGVRMDLSIKWSADGCREEIEWRMKKKRSYRRSARKGLECSRRCDSIAGSNPSEYPKSSRPHLQQLVYRSKDDGEQQQQQKKIEEEEKINKRE